MTDSDTDTKVKFGTDPTKQVLGKSDLDKKYLCDYVINTAVGCRHGCRFCYVPATPNITTRQEMLEDEADVDDPQKEWGEYVLQAETREVDTEYEDEMRYLMAKYPRVEALVERLSNKQKWRETRGGQGIVALSFSTDCYQDAHTGEVTRGAVLALTQHDRPDGKPIYTRILTRNPVLALQDLDVYRDAGDRVTIGTSIPCFNDDWIQALEPRAPMPEARYRGLKEFSEAGVPVYVSMSPTYPGMTKRDVREQMERFASLDPQVIFHEPVNPRGGNFEMVISGAEDAGEQEFAETLKKVSSDRDAWHDYAVKHLMWVQELGNELDVPVHLWPAKELVNQADGEVKEWLTEWRERQSPEAFADRPVPTTPQPTLPDVTFRTELTDF